MAQFLRRQAPVFAGELLQAPDPGPQAPERAASERRRLALAGGGDLSVPGASLLPAVLNRKNTHGETDAGTSPGGFGPPPSSTAGPDDTQQMSKASSKLAVGVEEQRLTSTPRSWAGEVGQRRRAAAEGGGDDGALNRCLALCDALQVTSAFCGCTAGCQAKKHV